jgi:capsular polysaccharide biosynthesis protein
VISNIKQRLRKRFDRLAWKRDIQTRNICGDLQKMAIREGWAFETIEKAFIVQRRPSLTIPEQIRDWLGDDPDICKMLRSRWLRERLSRLYAGEYFEAPPVFRVNIPYAKVHAPTGTVILPKGEVAVQSTVNPQVFFDYPFQNNPNEPEFLKGKFFLLGTRWAWNYAHWLFDSLPKFFGADENFTFLLHGDSTPFQTQSLNMLKISEKRIVRTHSEWVGVENLTVCVTNRLTGITHPSALKFVRKRLLKAAGVDCFNIDSSSICGPPLYIHRQKPARSRSQRTLLNETEVQSVFREFGFETIVPDQLSFSDQVKRFSVASAMAGAHGAGNHNNLFLPSGSPVIELYNPAWWDHTVTRIASLFDQPHYHLFGRNQDKQHRFTIEPQRLRKLLTKAMCAQDQRPVLEDKFH